MIDNTLPMPTVREIDGEPRLRDLDLAAALGLSQPRDIRATIDANKAELEEHGGLRAAPANPGKQGGRPGTEYWLNEGQALTLAILSRTERARLVRVALIKLFQAWRAGQLPPAPAPRPVAAPITAAALLWFGTEPRIGADILATRIGRKLADLKNRINRADGWPLRRLGGVATIRHIDVIDYYLTLAQARDLLAQFSALSVDPELTAAFLAAGTPQASVGPGLPPAPNITLDDLPPPASRPISMNTEKMRRYRVRQEIEAGAGQAVGTARYQAARAAALALFDRLMADA